MVLDAMHAAFAAMPKEQSLMLIVNVPGRDAVNVIVPNEAIFRLFHEYGSGASMHLDSDSVVPGHMISIRLVVTREAPDEVVTVTPSFTLKSIK